MTTPTAIRLLYLGRNKKLPQQIDDALQQTWQRTRDYVDAQANVELVQVTSQKQALDEIRTAPPHGILVEIDAGRYNRNRFCINLRSRLPRVILVAIHKNTPDTGFSFDGYIQRPFQLDQARAILSRLLDGGQKMYIQVSGLSLDIAMRMVDGPRGQHHLPPKLCKLLQVLMENVGDTVRREELMQRVWDTKFLDDTRTLDVHVRWLREKIEPDPSTPHFLHTVRGKGYRLEEMMS